MMPSSSGGGANSPQCTTHANEKTLMRMHAEGHGAVFPPFMGEIQLILGPMFSGKSTELLRRVRRFKYSKRKVLLLKYKKDTRYSEHAISTHDQDQIPAIAVNSLEECPQNWESYDVIAVDEGQFFPDLPQAIDRFACYGKVVIVSALNGTFERKGFSSVMDAIPLADRIDHLTAVCAHCGLEAPYSKRISNETDVEVIGSDDKYLPMCRRCFHIVDQRGEDVMINAGERYSTPTKDCDRALSDVTNKDSDPGFRLSRTRENTPGEDSGASDPCLGTPVSASDL